MANLPNFELDRKFAYLKAHWIPSVEEVLGFDVERTAFGLIKHDKDLGALLGLNKRDLTLARPMDEDVLQACRSNGRIELETLDVAAARLSDPKQWPRSDRALLCKPFRVLDAEDRSDDVHPVAT